MKKTSCFILATILSMTIFAQKEVITLFEGNNIKNYSEIKSEEDTLYPTGIISDTYSMYGVDNANNSYVIGSNIYKDKAKAQKFLLDGASTYSVIGGLIWFGRKGGESDSVRFNLWDDNGVGLIDNNGENVEFQAAPGTVLANFSDILSNINANSDISLGLFRFDFENPVSTSSDFYLGFDISDLYSDTAAYSATSYIGAVGSDNGTGNEEQNLWELDSNNVWKTLKASGWGEYDFDAYIYPLVVDITGIQENYFNGIILNIYPNPVAETATISFDLKESANNIDVVIADANGKVIDRKKLNKINAGANNISFDVTNYASGTYYCAFTADGKTIAKSFVK